MALLSAFTRVDALDRVVAELLDACHAHGIPVLFVLSRRRLGEAVGHRQPASVVAVRRVDGVEGIFPNVLTLAAEAAQQFAAVFCAAPAAIANAAGELPVHVAAAYGYTACLAALLRTGGYANVASTDARRWTPLHFAAHGGHVRTVQLLLTAGASPSIQDAAGHTPLAVAYLRHHDRAVAVLKPCSPALDLAALTRGPPPPALIGPAEDLSDSGESDEEIGDTAGDRSREPVDGAGSGEGA